MNILPMLEKLFKYKSVKEINSPINSVNECDSNTIKIFTIALSFHLYLISTVWPKKRLNINVKLGNVNT